MQEFHIYIKEEEEEEEEEERLKRENVGELTLLSRRPHLVVLVVACNAGDEALVGPTLVLELLVSWPAPAPRLAP